MGYKSKAEAIGKRIKSRRKELGLSAEEIALKMEVSPATIYRYESASIANMGIDKLYNLASLLETTPEYLMGWEDDANDYETIGNEAGIAPPRDYEGSYSDYVKYKLNETLEEDDALNNNKFATNCSEFTEQEKEYVEKIRKLSLDQLRLLDIFLAGLEKQEIQK